MESGESVQEFQRGSTRPEPIGELRLASRNQRSHSAGVSQSEDSKKPTAECAEPMPMFGVAGKPFVRPQLASKQPPKVQSRFT